MIIGEKYHAKLKYKFPKSKMGGLRQNKLGMQLNFPEIGVFSVQTKSTDSAFLTPTDVHRCFSVLYFINLKTLSTLSWTLLHGEYPSL